MTQLGLQPLSSTTRFPEARLDRFLFADSPEK